MQPTIVLTRPAQQAKAFANDLMQAYGDDLPILIAPLMDITPIDTDVGAPAHVVFTSANGVQQAARLGVSTAATAWCVGDQTAHAAKTLGFAVKNAQGTGTDLVQLIVAQKPSGKIRHLRGAHVTGRIVEQLIAAGFDCDSRIVYAQTDVRPSDALCAAFDRPAPLVIPLFSPRSAKRIVDTLPHKAPLSLVLISSATRAVAKPIPVHDVTTAIFPDKKHMIAATLQAYDALSITKTP